MFCRELFCISFFKSSGKDVSYYELHLSLPADDTQTSTYSTDVNSIVIIGANGSGKSRLGAWIEKNDFQHTHRIGAQRSLLFGNYIQQKSYEESAHKLTVGSDSPRNDHNQRWTWDGEKYNYTSSLLNDYEDVLSAIWAKKVKQESDYVQQCKECDSLGHAHSKVPEMVTDVLYRIWSSVFPHRSIRLDDGKVIAFFKDGNNTIEYKGREMSDGERVALYLICQALCVPDSKTIIIDEPELHLHRSIMNRLWSAVERERPDCLFIYITHDTEFAANHVQSDKIWVKSYDGKKWDYSLIEDSQLPSQLLFDIMGNRRKVLFVEGTSNSFDTLLYTQIFSNYYVVACGSCSKVIEQTKAMRTNSQLHHLECFGLIDRDYRSDNEISALAANGIYTLSVAEVENLFIVEELLDVVNQLQAFPDRSAVDNVKNFIIETRFKNNLQKQILSASIAELKYQLSILDVSGSDDTTVKNAISNFFGNLDFSQIKAPIEEKFKSAYQSHDYKQILMLFNCKALKDSIGQYFQLNNRSYCSYIIRQLNGPQSESIKQALLPYLPREIPI